MVTTPLLLPPATPPSRAARCVALTLLPLLLGIAITLTLRGYQFGSGNHTVYLIEPLREVHPELLANDWWTTHTLQYHVAFNKLTALLMRLGIVQPAFLVLYLLGVIFLHLAWLRLSKALGGGARSYLLSVLIYYFSAGGTGLGSYQFLQDSSFLPGNVANIAMLWGLTFWIEARLWKSAVVLAIASLFHLNYALIALAFWPVACFWATAGYGLKHRSIPEQSKRFVAPVLTFLLILLLALPSLLPALGVTLAHMPKMPLKEFVNLYVHLRHPHHYDPLSWPIALWISFAWPIPLAVLAYRQHEVQQAWRRAVLVFLFFMALQVVALLFAGILFVSEPLIQMSLFRFSIYAKLLSCIGAAIFLLDGTVPACRGMRWLLAVVPLIAVIALIAYRIARPVSPAWEFAWSNRVPIGLFLLLTSMAMVYLRFPRSRRVPLVLLICGALVVFHEHLGLQISLADDEDRSYLEVCQWARRNTPIDAVFVVPPNEQLFRFHAQRAIVVNFKNVPQLSSEMSEWKARLEAVLDEPLAVLPRRFDLAHAALGRRYATLTAEHLADVAHQYHATYVVTTHPLASSHAAFENDRYHLYAVSDLKQEHLIGRH